MLSSLAQLPGWTILAPDPPFTAFSVRFVIRITPNAVLRYASITAIISTAVP